MRSDWITDADATVRTLARDDIVGPGITKHGLRVTFAAEIKRVTGANDDQVAAALGDRDVRTGRQYTRHVEQEARIIKVFFGQYLKPKAGVSEAALVEHITARVMETIRDARTGTEQDLENGTAQAFQN
ncbi:hypothetical protein JQ616_13795 [Bradyrhizobium tropiciagri]|uniref:hypothetical protein n=1 Tax=Bradyrhizobium tropiciagri TaxID=312253 RepID=UPI001BA7D385|nr:hypothetical protein [Bradyrhizobium tropiciagri]MBR0896028.1 hypothetical protein [Bradyrhizobium tropiciagri]